RATDLAAGEERRAFRLGRSLALVRADRASLALSEAQAIAAEPTTSGVDLYNLACVASLAAAKDGASGDRGLAATSADRAIRWLAQAPAAGIFRDPELLALLGRDSDLDALRDRRDFLLLRLDATFPADPFAPVH